MILHTWQLIVLALGGWLNQQQQDVVEYLQEENRVLREQLKGSRGRSPILRLMRVVRLVREMSMARRV